MTAHRLTEVVCDTCHNAISDYGDAAQVRKIAADRLGWTISKGGRDVCYSCRDRLAPRK